MATIRVLAGLVVQSQAVYVPAGLVVGEPECRTDPQNCCPGSGGGTGGGGCCYPRPPARLWASLYGESAACECLDTCLPLDYDPPEDAWFSVDPIADFCVTGVWFLRLKCVDGSYRLDVVGEDHAVVLEGTPFFDFSCDPFLVAACFDDPEALVCPTPGQFCYFIVESECTPPDPGSGGGGSGSGGSELAGEYCLRIESVGGDCDCLEGDYPLSSNGPGAGYSFVGELCDSLAAALSLSSDLSDLTAAIEAMEVNGGEPVRLVPSGTTPPSWSAVVPVRGVGTGEGFCEGTIRFTVSEGPCPSEGGGLAVDCCADDPVSAALRAVFSEGTGDLVCLDGVGVPLSGIQGSPGVAQWGGTLPASCGLPDATLTLNCTGPGAGGWSMGCAPYGILGVLQSVSCLPFRLVFTTTAPFAGSGSVKVTITPA